MALPFAQEATLPRNRHIAFKTMLSVERRFTDKAFADLYHKAIMKNLTLGFTRKLTQEDSVNRSLLSPSFCSHHGQQTEQTTHRLQRLISLSRHIVKQMALSGAQFDAGNVRRLLSAAPTACRRLR